MPPQNPEKMRKTPQDRIRASQIVDYYKDPLRCLYEDIIWVASKRYAFVDPRTGVVEMRESDDGEVLQPFRPNWEQHMIIQYRAICKRLKKPTKIIVVKARARGISTVSNAVTVAENTFKNRGTVTMVSEGPENRSAMYDIASVMIHNLPKEILPDANSGKFLPRDSEKFIEADFPPNPEIGYRGGSFKWRLYSAEKGKGVAIGSRALHHVWTEFAKWGKDTQAMQGLTSTVIDSWEAFHIIESTAEGDTSEHAKIVQRCWKLQGSKNYWEDGYNWNSNAPFCAMFFPWWEADENRLDLVAEVTPTMLYADMTEYEQRMWLECLEPRARKRLGLEGEELMRYTMEQVHWFRALCILLPQYREKTLPIGQINVTVTSEEIRMSEYPTYIEEAFVNKGGAFIPRETADRIEREDIRLPSHRGHLDEDGNFCLGPEGDWGEWLKLWFPEKEFGPGVVVPGKKLQIPEMIALGGDVAHGTHPKNDVHDLSAAVGISVFKKVQRCEVNVRMPVPMFEVRMRRLAAFLSGGVYHNYPLVCVDAGDAGLSMCQSFAEDYPDEKNPNNELVYYSQDVSRQDMPERDRPGFHTSMSQLERMAWNQIEQDLSAGNTFIKSDDLLIQLRSLKKKSNGKIEAANKGKGGEGSKDDIADALKMANWHVYSLSCRDALTDLFPNHDMNGVCLIRPEFEGLGIWHPEEVEKRIQEEWRRQRKPWQPHNPPKDFMQHERELGKHQVGLLKAKQESLMQARGVSGA